MSKLNAYMIQEMLKSSERISVPRIQLDFRLNYREAKEFVGYLQRRGWIEEESDADGYQILPENMHLRRIERSEVRALIDNITFDCIEALKCMRKLSLSTGADFSALESAVQGDDDTDCALGVLMTHRLCFKVKDLYFSAVSAKTIEVLCNVVKAKREYKVDMLISGENGARARLEKMFDVLFDDE